MALLLDVRQLSEEGQREDLESTQGDGSDTGLSQVMWTHIQCHTLPRAAGYDFNNNVFIFSTLSFFFFSYLFFKVIMFLPSKPSTSY